SVEMDSASTQSSGIAFNPMPLTVRLGLLSSLILFYLADQSVKSSIRQYLPVGETIPLVQDWLHLTHVKNTGMAFSLFHNFPNGLLWINGLLFLVLFAVALFYKSMTRGVLISLCLILGGALGNLHDRWVDGHVTDFIDVIIIHYPVFNLADIFICTGVGLLLLKIAKGSFQS
ncbi:MAG: signal peptidase II, partial [Vampirovibrio sp.]|nr:signal peptidase II [Vampirovibrio sp.]